jgi:hypothetical protein
VENGFHAVFRQFENDAAAIDATARIAAKGSRSVEISCSIREQASLRIETVAGAALEGIENPLLPALHNLEDYTTAGTAGVRYPTLLGRAVEIASIVSDQAAGGVRAAPSSREGMENGLAPVRRQLENRAAVAASVAAILRRTIENACAIRDQSAEWLRAVRGFLKTVQHLEARCMSAAGWNEQGQCQSTGQHAFAGNIQNSRH